MQHRPSFPHPIIESTALKGHVNTNRLSLSGTNQKFSQKDCSLMQDSSLMVLSFCSSLWVIICPQVGPLFLWTPQYLFLPLKNRGDCTLPHWSWCSFLVWSPFMSWHKGSYFQMPCYLIVSQGSKNLCNWSLKTQESASSISISQAQSIKVHVISQDLEMIIWVWFTTVPF